jgi:hypothetical protein
MFKLNKPVTVIIDGVLITSLILFSGCSKQMNCTIDYEHAHKYVSEEGFSTYKTGEYEYSEGYQWSNDAKEITDNEKNNIKYLDKEDLLSIKENEEILINKINNNTDYTEYEYSYQSQEIDYYLSPRGGIQFTPVSIISSYDSKGNLHTETVANIPIYKTVTKYDWTPDINHENLTGNARDVTFGYYAYKIITDENGNMTIEKSNVLDNILNYIAEYPYFKANNYYVLIYSNIYSMENSYEKTK